MYDIGWPVHHLDPPVNWARRLLPRERFPRRFQRVLFAGFVTFARHGDGDEVALGRLEAIDRVDHPPGFDPRLGVNMPAREDLRLWREPEAAFDARRGRAEPTDGLALAGMDIRRADRVADRPDHAEVECCDYKAGKRVVRHGLR